MSRQAAPKFQPTIAKRKIRPVVTDASPPETVLDTTSPEIKIKTIPAEPATTPVETSPADVKLDPKLPAAAVKTASKFGWVISVIDTYNKDQAYRMYLESRESIYKKVNLLKQKYDSIEKDRFRVLVTAPYSETDVSKNKLIRCKKKDGVLASDILSALLDIDGFLIKDTLDEVFFEVSSYFIPCLEALLQTHHYEVLEI